MMNASLDQSAFSADEIGSSSEFRHGWKVVIASLLGVMLGANSIEVFTIGLFSPRLAAEFGWTQQQVLLSFSIGTLSMLASLAFVGPAIDRFEPRPIALIGAIGFSIPFASLFWLGNSLTQFYLTMAIASFFGGGSLPVVWTRLIAVWFKRQLGLAIGGALLGIGLSGALLKPLTAYVIDAFGWRSAYLVLGLLPLFVAVPAIFVWFKPPVTGSDVSPLEQRARVSGYSFTETLGDWRFWVLTLSFMPIGGSSAALIANMETILKIQGVKAGSIVGLVSTIGLALLLGRLVGGWLLDRMRASILGGILVAGMAVCCLFLLSSPISYSGALAAVCLLGFGTGVESDVAAYLSIQMFGARAYGKTGSCITVFSYGSAAISPLLFARVLDQTGTYYSALTVTFISLVVSTLLLLSIGSAKPGRWSKSD